MRGVWSLVTAPTQEPITLAEAKLQARIASESDTENALLRSYITTARQEAEAFMARGLFTQTLQLELYDWSSVIYLPQAAPLQTITHVKYYDTDGVLQTVSSSDYTVNTTSRPAHIARVPGVTWPTVQAERLTYRIVITYVAGWSTVAAIPERIKQGVRLYVAYLDADRDGMDLASANAARQAAERCWGDRIWMRDTECA